MEERHLGAISPLTTDILIMSSYKYHFPQGEKKMQFILSSKKVHQGKKKIDSSQKFPLAL